MSVGYDGESSLRFPSFFSVPALAPPFCRPSVVSAVPRSSYRTKANSNTIEGAEDLVCRWVGVAWDFAPCGGSRRLASLRPQKPPGSVARGLASLLCLVWGLPRAAAPVGLRPYGRKSRRVPSPVALRLRFVSCGVCPAFLSVWYRCRFVVCGLPVISYRLPPSHPPVCRLPFVSVVLLMGSNG